jgi:hypothetical protein
MNRKDFIQRSFIGVSGALLSPILLKAQDQTEPPPLKLETVKEFVIAGHGNLDKVKQMLVDYPNLLFASYDWGKGDFEEAIEGAGHVGNKDIANYLIEKGARPNLYTLTMLGKTDLVKPILEAYPQLVNAAGPHGFTLLHHAKQEANQRKSCTRIWRARVRRKCKLKFDECTFHFHQWAV